MVFNKEINKFWTVTCSQLRAIWGSQGGQKFLQIPVIWDLSHSAHIRQVFVWDQWPCLDQNHPSPTSSTEDVFWLLVGWSFSHFCLFLFPSRDGRITIGKTIPRMIPAWYQRSQNAQMKTLQMFCKGAGALLKMADFPAQTFHPALRVLCKTVSAPQKKNNQQENPKNCQNIVKETEFFCSFQKEPSAPRTNRLVGAQQYMEFRYLVFLPSPCKSQVVAVLLVGGTVQGHCQAPKLNNQPKSATQKNAEPQVS